MPAQVFVFVDKSWPGARTGGVAEVFFVHAADRHGDSSRRQADRRTSPGRSANENTGASR